jgi:hypothetical protein
MPATYVPTKTQTELAGVEVVDVKGRTKRLTGESLRMLTTDVVSAVASKFGGEKIAELLDELCRAESMTNGGKLRPDHRTRLAAVTLVLAYLVGRPVERSEVVTVNLDADSMTGLRERLKSSPAMRDALAGLLAEVAEESTKTDDTPAGDSQIIDG